ncbi:aminotransferase class I/II-fold pyridoxal phosphate-dependent enzyme [candidate division WOR-3 bacterium]|nr:aminotransferase class I/II-fold pyridoxal phosphate-dependent enzyme [candidate division WOR-3 bacterium]
MKLSSRIDKIPPYIFNEIDILKSKLHNPVDFGIGDPDLPTPDFIVNEAIKKIKDPKNHSYPSYSGMNQLREAISKYFHKRFGVKLNPDKEIIVLIGSKEGIAHSLQSLIDTNDRVLVPAISYPVYRVQTSLWGGKIDEFDIGFENQFIPSISDIEKKINKKTRILFLNYPNNPTGAIVPLSFYKKCVDLAKKRDLIIINDAVYTDIHHNKSLPPSLLQADKKKQLSLEFHSFSKTFNMTGWRIGFAVGNSTLIDGLKKIKMNTDSGVFNAIQFAAIKALKNSDKHIQTLNSRISARIDLLSDALYNMGFEFNKPKATFYIFARTKNNMRSMEFSKHLMNKAGIITAPGIGFGKKGDSYIRFSVTLPEKEIERGIKKMYKAGI